MACGVGQWLCRRSFTVNREVGGPVASPSLPPSSALRGLTRSASHLHDTRFDTSPLSRERVGSCQHGLKGFGFRNDEGVDVRWEFVLEAYFGYRSLPECGKEAELRGDAVSPVGLVCASSMRSRRSPTATASGTT